MSNRANRPEMRCKFSVLFHIAQPRSIDFLSKD